MERRYKVFDGCFSASGSGHYQQFEDVIILLQDIEQREIQAQGRSVKNSGCKILNSIVNKSSRVRVLALP